MEIGIAGLAGSGKTTLFNALTRSQIPVGGFSAVAGEAHRAVVKVPDRRLDLLAAMLKPKSVKGAEITYVDVPGLGTGIGRDRASTVLGQLRTVDALLLVVAAFGQQASADSLLADLDSLEAEFILSDLDIVERRIERLDKEVRLGAGGPLERQRKGQELELLRRFKEVLDRGQPLRGLPLSHDEETILRSFGLLSAKPALVIANVGDDLEIGNGLLAVAQARRSSLPEAMAIAGRLEMELGELEPQEAQEFMSAMAVSELCAGRVIQASYAVLDLISFLSTKSEEVRAWTLRRGQTALDAAAAIHSDIARGFIRAEVVAFDDLAEAGSLAEARHRGKLRAEGKQYVIQDGDVLTILFNV